MVEIITRQSEIAYGKKFPMEIKVQDSSLSDFTNNSLTITNNSRRVYVKRSIRERFHSFRVRFEAEVFWDALFKFPETRLKNNVLYKRIDLPMAIVRVFRRSILITLRSSSEVKGLDVRSAKLVSERLVNDALLLLPSAIKVKDVGCVSSVHNAFINHPFAEKNVRVNVNNEVRLISDNSHGSSEFEAVNTVHAVSDSECIEKDMISLIDKGLSRDFIAESLNILINDRKFYAENLRSHVQAIKDLSKGINRLNSLVGKLEASESVTSQKPLVQSSLEEFM